MEEFGCRKIHLGIGNGGRRKTLEKKNEKFDDSTVPILQLPLEINMT
jgi:hypothetical protein